MDHNISEEISELIIACIKKNIIDNNHINFIEKKSDFQSDIQRITEETINKSIIHNNENIIKTKIVEICRNFYNMGFLAGMSGNISFRLSDSEILITRSGINKGSITENDIIKVDRDGEKISGDGVPSSEYKMHIFSYKERKDIKAIVHAHPPFATGFAAAGIPLDKPVLPEAILVLGSIPLVEYGTPSTWEVPLSLKPYIADTNAFLLSNHGTLTFGTDLNQAANRTETIELFAKVILIARMLGGEKLLSEENLKKLSKTQH